MGGENILEAIHKEMRTKKLLKENSDSEKDEVRVWFYQHRFGIGLGLGYKMVYFLIRVRILRSIWRVK